MTQDEIVKMAREAGLVRTGDRWVEPARWGVTELVHFAALVAAAKCEELAAEAERNGNTILAQQIRARGNT